MDVGVGERSRWDQGYPGSQGWRREVKVII
jgi:hypothetical protein